MLLELQWVRANLDPCQHIGILPNHALDDLRDRVQLQLALNRIIIVDLMLEGAHLDLQISWDSFQRVRWADHDETKSPHC